MGQDPTSAELQWTDSAAGSADVTSQENAIADQDSAGSADLEERIRRLEEELLYRSTQKWRAAAVDGAVVGGKASGFPTATWKTPSEFPTPPTASTTTNN